MLWILEEPKALITATSMRLNYIKILAAIVWDVCLRLEDRADGNLMITDLNARTVDAAFNNMWQQADTDVHDVTVLFCSVITSEGETSGC